MIPIAINAREINDQMMPQQRDEPPYRSAKTLASEVFTLRMIRSSHCRIVSMIPSTGEECMRKKKKKKKTYNIPDTVKRRHDPDKQLL